MNIDYTKQLSEEFIREHQEEISWINISFSQKLSENFIREFQDKVYWNYISGHQKLSENFIREFQDKVSWINISWCQKLSEDFIREFQNKIYWKILLEEYGYKLEILKNNKYKIKSNNYCYNLSDFQELINLTLKLISLKAFS